MQVSSLVAFALVAAATTASAQQRPSAEANDDENVKRQVNLALTNIHRARCVDGPCAPATTAELARPPIAVSEARAIIRRGMLSGAAQVCGLDWQNRSFLPMMAQLRKAKKSDRQVALVSLLHGIAQSQASSSLSKAFCDNATVAKLEAQLTFRS